MTQAAPTRIRFRVLALVCLLSMITYLDRVCFGAAAPEVARELGLPSVASLKWAFTAFALAYAVFEIPVGWLGDVFGPRGTLLRIVSCWSVCTALTAAVGISWGGSVVFGFGSLVVLRFLFGAGEAGAYPNIARVIHNWFPPGEWATAQGYVWMSGRLMGGITPLLWAVLTAGTAWTNALVTWRGAFLLFGGLGLLWCLLFALDFRNHPAEHPAVNAAEAARIGDRGAAAVGSHGLPWRAFLASSNLWMLCLMYFCFAYAWFFNITYLPSFVRDRYGMPDDSLLAAAYKGAPLWVGAVGCLAGGFLIDWLIRRTGNRRWARSLFGAAGHAICAACWLAAPSASNVHGFVVLISAAALFSDLTLASSWATCQDVGGRFSASTAACMNTVGTLGAAAAAWLTGTLVERSLDQAAVTAGVGVDQLTATDRAAAMLAGYSSSFSTYAFAYVVAALCWLVIDSTRPIVRSSARPRG